MTFPMKPKFEMHATLLNRIKNVLARMKSFVHVSSWPSYFGVYSSFEWHSRHWSYPRLRKSAWRLLKDKVDIPVNAPLYVDQWEAGWLVKTFIAGYCSNWLFRQLTDKLHWPSKQQKWSQQQPLEHFLWRTDLPRRCRVFDALNSPC